MRARTVSALPVVALLACSLPARVEVRDGEALGPAATVRGSLRFFQGGELVLGSAAGSVTLTQNGPFSLPQPLRVGQPHALRVLEQPAGQRCALRDEGDGRFDPARPLQVVCAVAVQRSVWRGRTIVGAPSTVPLEALAPITLRLDEPAHALVWLHAAAVDFENTHTDARGNVLRLTLVDGERVVAEGVAGGGSWDTLRPLEVVAVTSLAPGEHSLHARLSYERRAVGGVTVRPLRARVDGLTVEAGPGLTLNAVVLESLRDFAGVVTADAARAATATEAEAPFGPAALAVPGVAARPALVALHAPELAGSPAVHVVVNDVPLAAARFSMDDQPAAASLLGFADLSPGAARVAARWSSWAAGASVSSAPVALSAVVFRPSLVWTQQSRREPLQSETEETRPLPALRLPVAREARALVGFQLARYHTEPQMRDGWVRVLLDGEPVTGCAMYAPPGAERASLPCAALGLVDVLPGEHTVALEVATYGGSLALLDAPINVFAAVLE